MNCYGVSVNLKNIPELDPEFTPLLKFNEAFLKDATKPVSIAVERADGQMAACHTKIHEEPEMTQANHYYIDRLVKTMIWLQGGFRVYVNDKDLYDYLSSVYCKGGAREFDWDFMSHIYEHEFEIVFTEQVPETKNAPIAMGGHLEGCRIGFDAGGSDRKVSAVVDGRTVYSEEVIWHPKTAADPRYHQREVLCALRTAAAHLPRVDGIGVSTAGIVRGDELMVSALLAAVPPERQQEGRTLYRRAAAAMGNVPLAVANDGDVTALAGYMSLGTGPVMGIAMGTSQAAGYVDAQGRVSGWLNELAFAPVDLAEAAPRDPWSGDTGVGGQYFSQDAVIRLAAAAGVPTDAALTPAQQLRQVQELARQGHPAARRIFRDMGVCLAHTLALYAEIYPLRHVMVLGRVASGIGGEWMTEICRRVLAEEYPQLPLEVLLPDDRFRRIGQSVAAASLPQVRP